MKYAILLIFLPIVIGVKVASKCPDLPGVKFNLTESLGKWYVIGRHDNPLDTDLKCEEVLYTKERNNMVTGRFTGINIETGEKVGYLTVLASTSGVYATFREVAVRGTEIIHATSWKDVIADPNFQSYRLSFVCQDLPEGGSDREIWIFSRSRTINNRNTAVIDQFIAKHNLTGGVDILPVDQKNCY